MKDMRTVMFLFAFLFTLGVFATQLPAGRGQGQGGVQGQGRQMPSVDDHLKVLSERLSLSPDQQSKIKVILETQFAQMQAISKDRLSEERGLREVATAQIGALLNDAQRKTFDEMQREHRGTGMGEGRGFGQGSGGNGRGQGQGQGCQMPSADDHLTLLSEKVNLSRVQQIEIKLILETQLARLQAIREDISLSPEDKMSKLRTLREVAADEVRARLNDGQKQEFDDLRQDRQERQKERQARGEDCSMIWIAGE